MLKTQESVFLKLNTLSEILIFHFNSVLARVKQTLSSFFKRTGLTLLTSQTPAQMSSVGSPSLLPKNVVTLNLLFMRISKMMLPNKIFWSASVIKNQRKGVPLFTEPHPEDSLKSSQWAG